MRLLILTSRGQCVILRLILKQLQHLPDYFKKPHACVSSWNTPVRWINICQNKWQEMWSNADTLRTFQEQTDLSGFHHEYEMAFLLSGSLFWCSISCIELCKIISWIMSFFTLATVTVQASPRTEKDYGQILKTILFFTCPEVIMHWAVHWT